MSIFLTALFAEGAGYLVYRPAKSWGPQESAPLRRANLNQNQVLELRKQGFVVEKDQPVFMLQMTNFQHRFLEGGGSGNTTEPPVWPLAAVRSQEANALPGGKGEGVSVCLVDSGVDHRHPALAGALQDGRNFVDSRSSSDLADVVGHGTAMATLIAGRAIGNQPVGVAPAAKISVAKVVAANGQGSLGALAEGFRWCMDRGQVINVSLGFNNDSQVMQDLMAEAARRGRTVVIAAGNDGQNVQPMAKSSSVIAVGSVNSQGQISRFSSRGPELDFFAPGEGIPVLGADGSVSVKSGTSLSAAITSGVEAIRRSRGMAQLKSKNPTGPWERGVRMIDALATASGR